MVVSKQVDTAPPSPHSPAPKLKSLADVGIGPPPIQRYNLVSSQFHIFKCFIYHIYFYSLMVTMSFISATQGHLKGNVQKQDKERVQGDTNWCLICYPLHLLLLCCIILLLCVLTCQYPQANYIIHESHIHIPS